MSEELVQLPEIKEIKELLSVARHDVQAEAAEDPELQEASKLIFKVMDILEEKTSKQKDFSKMSEKEKIDCAAHLNFLHCLLEDFFIGDEDFDDFDDEDEEYLNHFDEEDEEK